MSENTSFSADRRFNVTKTGLIGNQRESMLKNELQYLPQLGKSRARGHQLPPHEFTYGVANVKLDGGVAEGNYFTLYFNLVIIVSLQQTLTPKKNLGFRLSY
jgi:hypothetical protein